MDHAEINKIRSQYQAGLWPQFLQMLQIDSRVGDQILKSSVSVWEVLANEWCRSCLDSLARKSLAEAITAVVEGT